MASQAQWVIVPGAWARGPEIFGPLQAELGGPAAALVAELPKDAVAQASVDRYAAAVRLQVESALPKRAPVVVVAHGTAGALTPAVVSALRAARTPVVATILIAAYAPVGGTSVIALRPGMDELARIQLRVQMAGLGYSERALPVPTGAELDNLYLADLAPETAERLRELLVPEPFAVLDTPVDCGELATICPVHYVICEEDRSVRPSLQRTMIAGLRAAGCQGAELTLSAGSNVMLTQPGALAAALEALSADTSHVVSPAARAPAPKAARGSWWPWARRRSGSPGT